MQTPSLIRTVLRNNSTARPTVILQTSVENLANNSDIPSSEIKPQAEANTEHSVQKVKEFKNNGLVAAAFASLQEQTTTPIKRPSFTEKKIARATNVSELLAVHDDNSLISRQQALKIVSVLAQWSAAGKVQLSDFESDPRFIKMCKILSRGSPNKIKAPLRNNLRDDDLSMVLGVTGDDEAAKLVASITLPQMIKVMTTLAQKKRRSTPLLRSLSFNISRNAQKLDLKQCADLLYSMTILNFPESLLLERISSDAIDGLELNRDRSAVVGSILTSLGLLRYKDAGILDALSDWILKYHILCRPQDILALFQTLAVVNYQPTNAENLFKVLLPQLNIADVPKLSIWLDTIWSLVLLNKATEDQISSVLAPDFIKKLQDDSVSLPSPVKIKLLNINAYAQHFLPNYKGLKTDASAVVKSVSITRTKEKQVLVASMVDSLGSLFSSDTYLRSNVNTGMGFLIDAECVIDKKCNPVPVTSAQKSSEYIRIAIQAYDYHDICRGDTTPTGSNIFAARLLEAQGYQLMIVPYTDFNPRDKLVQRVQFLEKQLKNIAKCK